MTKALAADQGRKGFCKQGEIMNVYMLNREIYPTVDAALKVATDYAKTMYDKQHFEVFGEKIYGERIEVNNEYESKMGFIRVDVYGTNGELFFDGILIETIKFVITHEEAKDFSSALTEFTFNREYNQPCD